MGKKSFGLTAVTVRINGDINKIPIIKPSSRLFPTKRVFDIITEAMIQNDTMAIILNKGAPTGIRGITSSNPNPSPIAMMATFLFTLPPNNSQ